MSKSAWDDSGLPSLWLAQPTQMKAQVIAYLQSTFLPAPYWWQRMSDVERRNITLHLCAVGSVDACQHFRVRNIGGHLAWEATRKALATKPSYATFSNGPELAAREEANSWRRAHPQVASHWDESTRMKPVGMLYPLPNGGRRILPSIYTKLRDAWLRANGVYNEPAKMNQGHLKNTVALLNESHINLVDRMCELLGKMHGHLGNRPDLQAKIVDLFHDFEALQVDELYPIVELLASYIEPPQKDACFYPGMYGDWDDARF